LEASALRGSKAVAVELLERRKKKETLRRRRRGDKDRR
jgi:hypothetical protein